MASSQYLLRPEAAPRYKVPPLDFTTSGRPSIGDIDPRPGQWEGIAALRAYKRFSLYDAPGYGKMLEQAYAIVPPAVIVAPAHLTLKWYDWIQAHMPPKARDFTMLCTGRNMSRTDRILALAEANRMALPKAESGKRVATVSRNSGRLVPGELFAVIINKEMLRYETEKYESSGVTKTRAIYEGGRKLFEYPIPPALTCLIDEFHYMRGRNAVHSKGAVELFAHTPYLFGGTATPIIREPDDLFMQLRIQRPDTFTSYLAFEKMFLSTFNDGWSKQVIGFKSADAFLKVVRNYAIGRECDFGQQLIVNDPIVVEPSKAYRERLDTLRNSYRDIATGDFAVTAGDALTQVQRLISTCPDKLDALASYINENDRRLDGTRRGCMVYVWMHETARAVADHLEKATGVAWDVISGRISPDQREKRVQKSKHIVATIDSISDGIDASHLRIILDYEPRAMPGQEYQADSRVNRFRTDQQRIDWRPSHEDEPVIKQSFILKGTGDLAMHNRRGRRHKNMRELLDAVIRES